MSGGLVVITEQMDVAQPHPFQSLSLCFCQAFFGVPTGGWRQVPHHKLGVEGKESIGNIRAEGSNKGSNPRDFFPVYIAGDE